MSGNTFLNAVDDTDMALNTLRGILTALDHLNDATTQADQASPEADAVCVLIRQARGTLTEVATPQK